MHSPAILFENLYSTVSCKPGTMIDGSCFDFVVVCADDEEIEGG